mgnify:CR=1 FL=1
MEFPKNLAQGQLRDYLESHCDSTSTETYFRPFEQSELDKATADFGKMSMTIEDLKLQLKEETKALKETIDFHAKEASAKLKSIRKRGEEETGKVFLFKDYEAKTITTVNSFGAIISERRMTPEERQLQIDTNLRKIANSNG